MDNTFNDLTQTLIDEPKRKSFFSRIKKKIPRFIKDLLSLFIPVTIVLGSFILIVFIAI